MNKIYFTSDFHFCHDKDFIYEPRGFSSVHEMNEQIIKNFNEVMDWTDSIYILGDCFLNNNEEGMKLLKQIPGRKFIVFGNHDTDNRQEMMLVEPQLYPLGFAYVMKYSGYHFYLSHYPTITSNYDNDKPLKRKLINLCGHSHVQNKFKDMDKGLIYHCELDAHDNKPILIDDIIEDIKKYIKE
jgi:calcineurin-like phosphoesterase family protein